MAQLWTFDQDLALRLMAMDVAEILACPLESQIAAANGLADLFGECVGTSQVEGYQENVAASGGRRSEGPGSGEYRDIYRETGQVNQVDETDLEIGPREVDETDEADRAYLGRELFHGGHRFLVDGLLSVCYFHGLRVDDYLPMEVVADVRVQFDAAAKDALGVSLSSLYVRFPQAAHSLVAKATGRGLGIADHRLAALWLSESGYDLKTVVETRFESRGMAEELIHDLACGRAQRHDN